MSRPRRPHINDTQLAIYLADGLTYREVAELHGLTRNQVSGMVYRARLTRDRQKSSSRRLDPAFRSAVLKDDGPSAVVAKRWGITTGTLNEWRRGLGV